MSVNHSTRAPPPHNMGDNSTIYLFQSGVEVCFDSAISSSTRILPCIRNVITTAALFVTVLLCISKLFIIFKERKKGIERAFSIIFVLALLEALVFTVQWGYYRQAQLHFVGLFLAMIMFLVICVFYINLILKGEYRRDLITRRIYPLCIISIAYFITVLIYALADLESTDHECIQPPWIIFSASEFVLAQVFLAVGILLTRKLNVLTIVEANVKRKKRVSLWCLIIAFEGSACLHFAEDLVYKYASGQCDEKFGDVQSLGYTAYFFVDRLVGAMIPIWVVLYHLGPSLKSLRIRQLAKTVMLRDVAQERTPHDELTESDALLPDNTDHQLYAIPEEEEGI